MLELEVEDGSTTPVRHLGCLCNPVPLTRGKTLLLHAICYPREERLSGAEIKQHMSKSDCLLFFCLYFSLTDIAEHPLFKIKSLTS